MIEVLQPERSTLRVELGPGLDIGRSCDGLLIADERVSRQHLRLQVVDGSVIAIDLGSSNGTYIDGRRIEEPTVVEPGDVIELGRTSITLSSTESDGPPPQRRLPTDPGPGGPTATGVGDRSRS